MEQNKKYSFLIIVTFLWMILFSSNVSNAVNNTFKKIICDGESRSIKQTQDKGYILSGSRNGFLLLLKTDSLGDTLWTKNFGFVFSMASAANDGYDVIETYDKGYIVVGIYQPQSTVVGFFIIRTDSIGNKIWQQVYNSNGYRSANNIKEINDSIFLIGGLAGVPNDIALLKIDINGNILWHKRIDIGGDDRPGSFNLINDSNLIFSGETNNNTNGISGFVLKTNLLGDTSWLRLISISAVSSLLSINPAQNSGFILAGYSADSILGDIDSWLLRINDLGDTLWSKKYQSSEDNYFVGVQQTSIGDMVAIGTSVFNGISSLTIQKTDSVGIIRWTQYFNLGLNDNTQGMSLCKTYDDGLVAAGNYYQGILKKIFIIKPDENGIVNTRDINNLHMFPFTVFPNPFLNSISLYSSSNIFKLKNCTMQITNTLGYEVFRQVGDITNSCTIDLNFLKTGMYFLRIISDNSVCLNNTKILKIN